MTLARRPSPSILPFLLFSFLLHAALVAILPLLSSSSGASDQILRAIEVVALPERSPSRAMGRVVDVPPPAVPQENPDARLLATQGRRVKNEMVNLGASGLPAPPAAQASPQEAAEQARLEAEAERLRSEIDALRKKREAQRREARLRDREIARLRAQAAAPKARGNGGVNEPFDDMTSGPETRLNTREFEESKYFNDFKTSLGLLFHPSILTLGIVLSDTQPKRPRTIMSIEVNADGTLREARVFRSSGYTSLDRDALDAVRRVFPFDPPPRTLLTSRSTLRFAFEIIY